MEAAGEDGAGITKGPGDVEVAIGTEPGNAVRFGSDGAVEILRRLGYRYIAINPGSSFRGLHDSIVNFNSNRTPQLLLCLHEEIAVSLAHGYSKAGGGPIASAIHDLVGLMHASMAIYDAYVDKAPVVILGGSGPRDETRRRPIDWIHSADSQAELVRSFVKWDNEPSPASAFPLSVAKAHQIANSAPFGPTYVSLDCGLQEEQMDAPRALDLRLYQPVARPYPSPSMVAQVSDLLLGAEMPLVVCGRTGQDREITGVLVQLVERLGAAYCDDRNCVSFPTDHANNANLYPDIVTKSDVILAVEVPDLVSSLGLRDDNGGYGLHDGITLIDLSAGDFSSRSWSNLSSMAQPSSLRLNCDPVEGLKALVAHLATKEIPANRDNRNALLRGKLNNSRAAKATEYALKEEDTPISQIRLVSELWKAVQHVEWVLGLRNTRTWPEGIWKFSGAGEFLGHSGGGGVGYGPGAMVGCALAAFEQGKLAVGIIGDGDFLMASAALWTAVHYHIPMLLVINDNSSFYNDEPHQVRVAVERARPQENSWIGMRIGDPDIDLASLARSYGCWSMGPINDPEELGQAFTDAVSSALDGHTCVVHVHTSR